MGDSGGVDASRHPRDRLRRELSLVDATLLVVASVIGSGIFLTPGSIASALPHPGLIFAVWIAGGLLSLAGALANAELGAMYPHAGGDYVFLREAFHPVAGFLVGWLTFFVIYAGTIATLAAGFAEGMAGFVPLDPGAKLGLAISLTIACTALNVRGVRLGAAFNNLTAGVKVIALVIFVIAGPLLGAGSLENVARPAAALGDVTFSAFGLALAPVLFSYLGWNASLYVASEIRDPGRTIPRSLFLGLALCTAIYLAVNAVYLYALPVAAQAGQGNVGEAAARALFGGAGGAWVAGFVLASILGTLNATILVGPRIAYAMALDGRFFGGVDRVHAVYRTPSVALVAQALTAIGILLVLRSFPSVLDYTTFAIVLATMADVAALYALRRRRPELARPYRAWGYPWVPALYVLANLAIAAVMLQGRPFECAVGLAVLAGGLPFFLYFRAREDRSAA